MWDRDSPRVLERVAGRLGELVLRGDGSDFEVISNGVFLMDTRNGASERLLVRVALRELRGCARLLLGGLGVGFSLAEVVCADLVAWLGSTDRTFDGICLDVDNGPGWTVAEANGALYSREGLALLRERLVPGGTLTIWSANPLDGFAAPLREAFGRVESLAVEVPRGEPDVVYAAWRD